MDSIKAVTFEYRDPNTLISYARNPRKNDHLVEKFASQIKEFGMPVPICITPDGQIIDGHLRVKAAKFLKLKEVPVAVNGHWTPQQIKAFRISVNKTAEWAEWDNELLKLELEELEQDHFDLLSTGFNATEINKIMDSLSFDGGDGAGGENPDAAFDGEDTSHVKMIQLFYDEETEANFRGMVQWLDARFSTGNISDTVFSALQKCVAILESQDAGKAGVKAEG